MIEVKNIYKTFQAPHEVKALVDVSCKITAGEVVVVIGPSGSGKTTFLNIAGLLEDLTSGTYELDGRDISSLNDRERSRVRNEKIGFIFQSFHLINDLPVLDNVELPLLYRKGVWSGQRRKKAKAALEKVGLSARVKHYPNQLSGGQRQRVAIARAIIGQPEIILADEPTGNLDSKMGAEIMEILKRLNKEEGTTIVMVTHDEILAERTNRIIRFFDGRQVN